MPFSRFDEGFRYSRGSVKTFLKYLKSGNASGAPQDVEQREQKLKSIERELLQKKREHSQMVKELRVAKREANRPERVEQIGRIKSKEQEIFRLENKLRTAKAHTEDGPEEGSLPDFVIIGAPKCGTTFLYHLLSKHPHVEPGAFKEVHYFDLLFDKGTEWYQTVLPVASAKERAKDHHWRSYPRLLILPRGPRKNGRGDPTGTLDSVAAKPG